MRSTQAIGRIIAVIVVVVIVVVAGVGGYAYLGLKPSTTQLSSTSIQLGTTSSFIQSGTTSSLSSQSSSSITTSSSSSSSSTSASTNSSSSTVSTSSSTSSNTSSSTVPASKFGIADATTAMGVNATSGVTMNRTSLFSVNDTSVYSWLNFTNIASPTHNVTWNWFSPQSALYYHGTYVIPDPGSGQIWTYFIVDSSIFVNRHNASELPGAWQVDVYFDGAKSWVQTFTINSSSSIPKTRLVIGDSAFALSVNSVTNATSNRTLSFSVTDPSVYFWLNFTNVPSPNHNITFVWLSPQNNLYFNTTYIMPDPGAGKTWLHVSVWSAILVAGHPAAQMKGTWEVDTYVDGVRFLIQTFMIQ